MTTHLDDDQTELTLQQEEEALSDARCCVTRLKGNKQEMKKIRRLTQKFKVVPFIYFMW